MPKLTEPTLRQYRPGPKRREIRDSQAPNLYLVVQAKPSRTMSWALRFRRPDGRTAKMTIGSVDLSDEPRDAPVIGGALTLRQARELAAKIDRERARGDDVIEEQKANRRREANSKAEDAANTFGALLRAFFIDHKTKRHLRPRHWRADARLLGLDYPAGCDPARTTPKVIAGSLAATWADKPISEIDDAAIHTVVDEARKLGIPGLKARNDRTTESRGRKMHAALSVLFRWAVRKRKVASNPTLGVDHPGAPPARDRVLSAAERRWFWKACDKIGPPYGPLFQMLLLTGQRRGEVLNLRRRELSDELQTWTLPATRTKNHREHLVPLAPLARALIARSQLGDNPDAFIFRTSNGNAVGNFAKAKKQLDKAMAEVARREDRQAALADWRLHDLRRTCATGMADAGVLPHVIEAVLNHVSGTKGGIAGVYNRAAYWPEKKAALERWALYLDRLTSGRSANVVSLPRGRPS